MRILVLLPHRNFPTAPVIDEWLNIYPAAKVTHHDKRITLTRPDTGEELLRVEMSVLDQAHLRGAHFDEVDVRLVVPADYSPSDKHFLAALETMSARSREDAGHDMMPLEVAWHLGLIVGDECDWGDCNGRAIAARYDKALTLWLPVCYVHQFAPLVSPSGDPVRTPVKETAAPGLRA